MENIKAAINPFWQEFMAAFDGFYEHIGASAAVLMLYGNGKSPE